MEELHAELVEILTTYGIDSSEYADINERYTNCITQDAVYFNDLFIAPNHQTQFEQVYDESTQLFETYTRALTISLQELDQQMKKETNEDVLRELMDQRNAALGNTFGEVGAYNSENELAGVDNTLEIFDMVQALEYQARLEKR